MLRFGESAAKTALALLAVTAWAGALSAHPPYGLVVDRAGNAYFSDLEAVWRVAPDGRLTLFRPGQEGVHVHELTIAPDGAIEGDVNRYEASSDTYYTAIWRRTPGGREGWVLAPTATPPKGMGVWVDRSGSRYTAQWPSHGDRRTMLFQRSPSGEVTLLYGPAAEAAKFRQVIVSSVGGIAFAPFDALVVADGRVLREYSSTERRTILYQGPPSANLRGIAYWDGHVLAADMGRRQVLDVAWDGKARTVYRSPAGWMPTAVAMARLRASAAPATKTPPWPEPVPPEPARLLVLEANSDPYDYVNRVRLVEVADGRGRVVAAPGDPRGAPPAPAGSPPAAEQRGASPGTMAAMAACLLAVAAGMGLWLRRLRDRRKAAG